MGIIAYCPTGHRMKVKDHLAGKKGICPTCGARFRIPHASMPAAPRPAPPVSGNSTAPRDVPAASDLPIAAIVSLDPAAAVGLPEVLLLADPGVATVAPAHEPPMVDPDPTADLVIEAEPDEPAGDVAADDVFWFIAIPGGQPSAAMKEPEMRGWLESGQATGREVVWRSDWPDWRPITDAFPEQFPRTFPGVGGW
jgi:hypothetical protein